MAKKPDLRPERAYLKSDLRPEAERKDFRFERQAWEGIFKP